MKTEIKLAARPVVHQGWHAYEIRQGGAVHARIRLQNLPSGWVVEALPQPGGWVSDDDEVLAERVRSLLGPDDSARTALLATRQVIEAEQEEWRQQAEAEAYAENAWLRAAEAPTNEDYAFEQWERERGL